MTIYSQFPIWILGIDPGTDGAAALYKVEKDCIILWRVLSFKHEPNWTQHLATWLWAYRPAVVALERVNTMPGQGVVTQGKFMRKTGGAEAVLSSNQVTPRVYQPTWWQSRIGLPPRREIVGKEKRRAVHRKDQKQMAKFLFPDLLSKWVDKQQGDVYGGVLIGYAAVLDATGWYPVRN